MVEEGRETVSSVWAINPFPQSGGPPDFHTLHISVMVSLKSIEPRRDD